MDTYRKNEFKMYISDALYSAILLIVTGPFIQSVMLEMGLTEGMVSSAFGVFQILQGCMMILASPITDKIKNVPRVCAWLLLSPIALLGVLAAFGGGLRGSIMEVYTLFLTGGCVTNIILGIYNVLCYKRPFHIINMKHYGRITANNTVITGVVGVLFSGILTLCLGNFEYFNVIFAFSAMGILMIMVSFFVASTYKRVEINHIEEKCESMKVNLLRYKPFYALVIPNLFRGIGTGIFGVAVTIGYSEGVLNSISGSYVNIAAYVATFLGGIIYSRISGRIKNGKTIIVSCVLTAMALSSMLVLKNTAIFIAMYTLSYIVINIGDIAIPVSVSEFVDYRVMGRYTAWRMMLHTIGTAIGGFITPVLLTIFGGAVTLIVAGVLRIVTGIGYYLYTKNID